MTPEEIRSAPQNSERESRTERNGEQKPLKKNWAERYLPPQTGYKVFTKRNAQQRPTIFIPFTGLKDGEKPPEQVLAVMREHKQTAEATGQRTRCRVRGGLGRAGDGRVQITTDGLRAYVEAVEQGFGGNVDYAVLHKVYGAARPDDARYSPADVVGVQSAAVIGSPEPRHVSTSYVERQNLTMRMRTRRFTRLTNAFSKKLANHEHAVALYFMHYNFIARHATLRMPPALKAGVTDHWWTYEELVELIDRTACAA